MDGKWSVRFPPNLSLASNCPPNCSGLLSITFQPCLLRHVPAPAQINQSHLWGIAPGKEGIVYVTLYPIQFPKRRPDIDKMRSSPVPADPPALFALPLIISSDIGPTICSTRLRRTSTLLEILSHLQVASLEGKK